MMSKTSRKLSVSYQDYVLWLLKNDMNNRKTYKKESQMFYSSERWLIIFIKNIWKSEHLLFLKQTLFLWLFHLVDSLKKWK